MSTPKLELLPGMTKADDPLPPGGSWEIRRLDDGRLRLVIRAPDAAGNPGEIVTIVEMTPEQARQLVTTMLTALPKEQQDQIRGLFLIAGIPERVKI